MEEKKVRTRFAPSPTGYMHIGNLRTAPFGLRTPTRPAMWKALWILFTTPCGKPA